MSKVVLNNLNNLQNENSAVAIINANNDTIEQAFDNTISRDGSNPNKMESALDMNSNRILNLPVPINSSDPVRLAELDAVLATGDGNVIGPTTAVSGNITIFQGTSGKLVADSGVSLADISNEISDLNDLKADRAGDTFTGAVNVPTLTASTSITTPSTVLGKSTGVLPKKYLTVDDTNNNFGIVNKANNAYVLQVSDSGVVTASSYLGDGTLLSGVETLTHAAATYSPILRTIQTSGGNFTLLLGNIGALIQMTNTSTAAVTIPADSTTLFPIGTQIDIVRSGTGTVNIAPASGVFLQSSNNLRSIASVNAAVTLVKTAANSWYLFGSLA